MQIKSYGHACFAVTSSSGEVILHDPYIDMLGYVLPKNIKADVVLSSHDHRDHNYTESLAEGFEFINQTGTIETAVTSISGIESFHDQSEGAERGLNTIYSYVIDGVKVCHLGDLGHTLNEQQIAKLQNIDLLLMPVGGGYTIDDVMGVEVFNQLQPKHVIPMHYRTADMGEHGAVFKEVTDFTDKLGLEVYKSNGNVLEIDKDSLEQLPPVIIIDYK